MSRKFFDFDFFDDQNSQQSQQRVSELHPSDPESIEKLIQTVRQSVIGDGISFQTPFGTRRLTYCDYTASGRSLSFIEDFIREQVLPFYGNTHTTTSVTGIQTTLFREEARKIIKQATGATENDSLIFCGNGVTAAIHVLVNGLQLDQYEDSNPKPIVFITPYEHHSNILPWRNANVELVVVPECRQNGIDLEYLEEQLKIAKDDNRPLIIGSFSAASNISGILTNVDQLCVLMHRYDGLAFFDYATAGPYVSIDMNNSSIDESAYRDAVFLSPHKMVGGPQTPGILIAKDTLFQNPVPLSGGGGGSVFFVSSESHQYLQQIQEREESGTPNIIGSIRAGLVFQLKDAIGQATISKLEHHLCSLAMEKFDSMDNIIVLGKSMDSQSHLPIFSIMIEHPESGMYLHHNFICAVLNDLFGIQSRSGCMCAGPYAQSLLGIDQDLADDYQQALEEDSRIDRTAIRRQTEGFSEMLRPGVVRFNFNFFISEDEFQFVTDAIGLVGKHGWRLLPLYKFNAETGEWKHRKQGSVSLLSRKWLGGISFRSGEFEFQDQQESSDSSSSSSSSEALEFQETLDFANDLFEQLQTEKRIRDLRKNVSRSESALFDDQHNLRWFLLPSEAVDIMSSSSNDQESNDSSAEWKAPFRHESESESESSSSSSTENQDSESESESESLWKWKSPPKKEIMIPILSAVTDFTMIENGDRVLLGISGGKDSLTMLHAFRQLKFNLKSKGIEFDFGAVTVDPQSPDYDPSPLIEYMDALKVPYFYESQDIMETAKQVNCSSICSFCSRMKRGRLYACARREGYNVIALGQHLDDLAESFMMSFMHNGVLRTMKANYEIGDGDLRVIRPMVFVREISCRTFAHNIAKLPVLSESCPACFQAPTERARMKQVLAAQEALYPDIYHSMREAMIPLMKRNKVGMESQKFANEDDE